MAASIATLEAEVRRILGRNYTVKPASDGTSVEVRSFAPRRNVHGALNEAFAAMDRLKAAGMWAAEPETYWNADVANLMAEGHPFWVGRTDA